MIIPVAAIIGACLGSFAACTYYRIPKKIPLTHPPSHCPACKAPLCWYENIPIVSYLIQQGQCRRCAVSLSPAYMVFELGGAILGLIIGIISAS